jgi:serine protease Do
MRGLPFDRDQLRRFFPDRDGDGQPDIPDFDGGSEEAPELHGTGSGVIMEAGNGTGWILTNNHVAGDATQMEVTLADGRKITKATLVGADKKTDLAVVKIEADRLIPAKWGDSDELQKGDWVMAFGSPFGYVGSMTHGIVSALNRTNVGIIRQGYENFIQVDAPINPGNSGGPLVNTRGEVVGINTAIASRTGAFSGIGFAIPSNQAKYIYQSLKNSGHVARGWLGVSISDVSADPDLAHSFGFQANNGVLVGQIMPNTPATGKLKAGDIITSYNGKAVKNVQELREEVARTAPKTEVKLGVFRDGKDQTVAVTLGEQPEDLLASANGDQGGPRSTMNGEADAGSKLGLRLADPTDDLVRQYELDNVKSGAVITAVERNSAAARANLSVGDVITKVNSRDVKTAQEANDALKSADLKKGVRLYVTTKDPGSGQTMSRFVFLRETK